MLWWFLGLPLMLVALLSLVFLVFPPAVGCLVFVGVKSLCLLNTRLAVMGERAAVQLSSTIVP